MATNLQIDDKLIQTAVKLGKHKTKKDAVTKALVEYIDHLQQQQILSIFGKEFNYTFKNMQTYYICLLILFYSIFICEICIKICIISKLLLMRSKK